MVMLDNNSSSKVDVNVVNGKFELILLKLEIMVYNSEGIMLIVMVRNVWDELMSG